MTKLYHHNTTSSVTGTLPTTSQSTQGTPTQTVDATTVNRTMNTTIGTTQTSKSLSATSANVKQYFTRFVSDTLNSNQTINANTWNFAFANSEALANGNFPRSGAGAVYVVVYVWRPSNGTKVGNILDGASDASTFAEPSATGTEKSNFGTFTGSSVTALSGDVICQEIYFTPSPSQASTNIYYYDGTTETNNTNTTVSNHASYIETPQTLTFGAGSNNVTKSLTETITVSDSLARLAAKQRLSGAFPTYL